MLFLLLLSRWHDRDFSSALLCLVIPFLGGGRSASTNTSNLRYIFFPGHLMHHAPKTLRTYRICVRYDNSERLSLMRFDINTFVDDSHLHHYLMQCVLLRYSELDTLSSLILCINSWVNYRCIFIKVAQVKLTL